MAAERNAEFVAKGGQELSILMDGTPAGHPPTKTQLDTWIDTPELPYSAVLDNIGTPDAFVDYYGVRQDYMFIFDLRTMVLVEQSKDVMASLDDFMALLDAPPH